MNNYEIILDYEYQYSSVLKKVIDKTLEIEKIDCSIFSIIFVDNDKIKEINNEYRGIDKVTDVISFALNDKKNIFDGYVNVLGDIFICIPRMKEQAHEYGHSETRELCFLTVHGLLHLLGYDHMNKKDEEVMFKKQEEVLNEFEETRRNYNR